MGFLIEAEPLAWPDSVSLLRYVRDHGIEQFLHVFHRVKGVREDLLRWGDEIEYGVFKLDEKNKRVMLSTRMKDALAELQRLEAHGRRHGLSQADTCSWQPEYGAWMLEATPSKPFEGLISLTRIEDHMRLRRSRITAVLRPDEVVLTLACCPVLGVGDHVWVPPSRVLPEESALPGGPVANSLFVPDSVITDHPRFHTLTKNIRARRRSKVAIRRRKFKDVNTVKGTPWTGEPTTVEEADALDEVYADAMAFGMGCCCLQVTFQAKDIGESRHLYDHLAVLTPIMLALTAATPVLRGWLLDDDARWEIVGQSVDDRTPAERSGHGGHDAADSRLAGDGVKALRKPRYSSIDCFLCNCREGKDPDSNAQHYNDLAIEYDSEHFQRLCVSGVDQVLAKHVAHLFARDPLVIFKERVVVDDRENVDHWENLQSTNWQTVRWKPPPPHKAVLENSSEEHIGWRVEFRSMEVQMTDFENAAFVVFVVLLSRVVLGLDLNLYIPISKMEDNMKIASKRDALRQDKFWFRSCLLPSEVHDSQDCDSANEAQPFQLMTVTEILSGTDKFPGLIPLCHTYLDFVGCDCVTRDKINLYLEFIQGRASGVTMTAAQWQRKFIHEHPDYKQDSKVSHSIAFDLMREMRDIAEGRKACPDVLGSVRLPEVHPASNPFASSANPQPNSNSDKGTDYLHKYLARAQEAEERDLQEEVDTLAHEVSEREAALQRAKDELKVSQEARVASTSTD